MTSGNGLSLTWTAFDKPESISRGSNTLIFFHDPERARFKQVGPTGETLYLNDGGVMSERLAGSGGTVEWTDYLFAAEEMIGMRVEHSVSGVYTRYFQKDHLNSIAVITYDAGAVVEQLSYDAWGKRRHAANGADDPAGSITSQTNRGFTGHEQLEEVGLIHMNGRVYDPLIGRFTSADPVTPEPYTITQSWNRYAYVVNNPLKFRDPTGHAWTDSLPGWPGTASSAGSGTPNDSTLTGGLIAQGQDGTEKEQSTGVKGMANDEPVEAIEVAACAPCVFAYWGYRAYRAYRTVDEASGLVESLGALSGISNSCVRPRRWPRSQRRCRRAVTFKLLADTSDH